MVNMRNVRKFKTHVPIWALSYINDLDYFTIEPDKLRAIDQWKEAQKQHMFDVVEIDLISFTGAIESSPAFGEEPCVCGECIVTIKRPIESGICLEKSNP